MSDQLNSGDTAEVQQVLATLTGQAELLRRKAPAEVAADTATVAAFTVGLDQLLRDYGYDLDAVADDEQGAVRFGDLTSDDFTAAQRRLVDYAEQ
ncbi:MAG TPA: hypothetical protein PLV68_11100, partial [Ilumatobacteraceae bacterium]|nr:hypothetical protein [Ilumatobacteraceae bacterium]